MKSTPIIFALALLLAACSKPVPKPPAPQFDVAQFDGDRALYEVRGLVGIGARDAGTPGAKKAAEQILHRLAAIGLKAEIDVFTDKSPKGNTIFRNVIGRIPGTGPGLILICSHYDTKSGIAGFVGANDSGSSCGALIELARVIFSGPPVDPSFQFVFFDGEECMDAYGPHDGFHGSRHHASQLVRGRQATNVLAMILLDMIGDKSLSVTLPRNSSQPLLNKVLLAARAENVREKFSLHPFGVGDDHVPFLEAGIPAIDLIDFEFGSAPGLNDYWHTTADTLDKISAESLGTVGRVTIRMINGLIQERANR